MTLSCVFQYIWCLETFYLGRDFQCGFCFRKLENFAKTVPYKKLPINLVYSSRTPKYWPSVVVRTSQRSVLIATINLGPILPSEALVIGW